MFEISMLITNKLQKCYLVGVLFKRLIIYKPLSDIFMRNIIFEITDVGLKIYAITFFPFILNGLPIILFIYFWICLSSLRLPLIFILHGIFNQKRYIKEKKLILGCMYVIYLQVYNLVWFCRFLGINSKTLWYCIKFKAR